MSEKFREIYHIGTNRCPGHDYSAPGTYFITICTQKKIPYFGEMVNGELLLSGTGIIVRDFWLAIPDHFPNVKLDEFVIMPDHLHGIIIIKSSPGLKLKFNNLETPNTNNLETAKLGVSTEGIEQVGKSKNKGNPNWKSNSVGSIINQYKRICTIKSKSFGLDLVWQPRYYDHIIRSESELNRIRSYIKNNPKEFNE
jgi:REP element-mobilizing transposase RayT